MLKYLPLIFLIFSFRVFSMSDNDELTTMLKRLSVSYENFAEEYKEKETDPKFSRQVTGTLKMILRKTDKVIKYCENDASTKVSEVYVLKEGKKMKLREFKSFLQDKVKNR